jgi:hypothetical protein
MYAQVVEITPELAREWLEMNTRNRPLKKFHVDQLSSAMKAGKWKLNGDTICLNGSSLIDGQHRLAAIVQSGATVRSLVVTGVDSDVFATKDIGRRRGGADVLSILGEDNAAALAAGLTLVARYDDGVLSNYGVKSRYGPTDMEMLLARYPGMRESVKRWHGMWAILPPSVVTAAHYITARIDRDAAETMLEDLRYGAGLAYGDPVLLLRNRCLANQGNKGKLKQLYLFAIYIKAWNGRRRGATMKNLRWREDGKAAESFPVAL